MKWEYIIERGVNITTAGLEKLRAMGEDGWELVTVVKEEGFFKRPKPLESKICSTCKTTVEALHFSEETHSLCHKSGWLAITADGLRHMKCVWGIEPEELKGD